MSLISSPGNMSSLLSCSPSLFAFLARNVRKIGPTLQDSRSLSAADTLESEQYYVSSSEPMANLHDRKSVKTDSTTRLFMKSVTIPSQAQDLLVQHNTLMMEFKIDKVCIPSRYKGWATIAEKDDAASLIIEDLPAEISIISGKPLEDHQEPSAQDSDDVLGTVSDIIERNPRTDVEYDSDWWTAFRAANGVVSPSRLKPGQSPIKSPEGGKSTQNHYRNKCLICGDFYSCRNRLKPHFVDCVGRNGNPQGFYWNVELNSKERLGGSGCPWNIPNFLARFSAVNGVVLPSLLKPGQSPIHSPYKKPCARIATGTLNKNCPICGDWFERDDRFRFHFVGCVGRNGNPQGFYWNAERLGPKTGPIHKDPRRYGKIMAKLDEVNGVVLPSLLKPGQPPIQSPYVSAHKRGGAGKHNCSICGDSFRLKNQVKVHFAPCVQRNGNPLGYHWNDSLERRIGKETAALYCENQDTEASISEGVSSDHTISYEPSESCNSIQSSSPRSLALTPRLRHERNDYTEAPPVARTRTDHDFGSAVIELSDEEAADMDIGTAQPQGPPSKQPRDPQVRTHRLPHERIKSALVISTIETNGRDESEAIVVSDHDSIHGDFDAIHTAPKTAVPTLTSHGRHTSNNSFTALSPKDFGAGRSPVPSPSTIMTSWDSPADSTNGQRYLLPKVLPSSATLGRQKRHVPSELSPLFRSSKRPRLMPSQPADLLQPNTIASPFRQFVKEGTQISQAPVERSATNLSRNGPMSCRNIDGDHVANRQAEGAGLTINTEVAEGTALPEPGDEPTSLEKLCTDFLETREDLCKKIDDMAGEVNTAKERAIVAERSVQEAENRVYQANNARFATVKQMEDQYKKESGSLKIRCDTLDTIIHRKNQAIDQLTYDLLLVRAAGV